MSDQNGTVKGHPEFEKRLFDTAFDGFRAGKLEDEVIADVEKVNRDYGHPPVETDRARWIAGTPFRKARKRNQDAQEQDDEPVVWDAPIPLGKSPELPAFPVDVLPAWWAAWVRAIAEATQTPPDLAAMLALSVCAAGLATKFRVQVREGWCEPVNLYVAVALFSGERKSAVFREVLAPVQAYEREEKVRMQPLIAERASEHRMLEGRLKDTEKKAAQAKAAERHLLVVEAKKLARELADHEVPVSPQFYCDDTTCEKLAQLLGQHGGRMLQAGAEGTAFEMAKGRYSEGANLDVYLKAYSGDPLRVGRVSRAEDIADQPALSVALAVQPSVIAGLAEGAAMRTRGFLARFLYGLPPSRVGSRKIAPGPVPVEVTQRFQERVRRLWQLEGDVGNNSKPTPHLLEFSPEADREMREFESWLEPQLAEGQALAGPENWANKLAGCVARISGVLHIATHDNGPWFKQIPLQIVKAAVRLAKEYLLQHAMAAFDLMGADPRLEDAKRVLKWLREYVKTVNCVKGCPVLVTKRDIHANVWGGSRRAEDLDAVLEILVQHNYLRPLDEGPTLTKKRGRRSSPKFLISDTLFTDSQKGGTLSQNPQNSQKAGG